jgi:hypothetical protein
VQHKKTGPTANDRSIWNFLLANPIYVDRLRQELKNVVYRRKDQPLEQMERREFATERAESALDKQKLRADMGRTVERQAVLSQALKKMQVAKRETRMRAFAQMKNMSKKQQPRN